MIPYFQVVLELSNSYSFPLNHGVFAILERLDYIPNLIIYKYG